MEGEYSFLQFSLKENLMFCKTCLKFEDKIKSSKNYNSSFVEGCSKFRKMKWQNMPRPKCIKKPVSLKTRKKRKNLESREKKMTLTANTAIRESLRNMGKLSENRLKSLEKQFHVAYHIAP